MTSGNVYNMRDVTTATPSHSRTLLSVNLQQFLQAIILSGVVGTINNLAIGTGPVLSAADVLTGRTEDTSTGGTTFHLIGYTGIEFDA